MNWKKTLRLSTLSSLLLTGCLGVSAQVTVYKDCNYSGTSANLGIGTYNANYLNAAGIGTNTISSLRITPGYLVELSNEIDGIYNVFSSPCLVNWQFSSNDAIGNYNDQTTQVTVSQIKNWALFYRDCNYGGTATALAKGNYDWADLIATGVNNDQLSSLFVPQGMTVTLYSDSRFSGISKTFTPGYYPCLVDYGFNDVTSSLVISGAAKREANPGSSDDNSGSADDRLQVSLSPNPATSNIQLHFENAEAGEIQIQLTNLQGQAVIKRSETLHAGANDMMLDRGTLPAGMYIMQIVQDGNRISKKVVFK